MTGAESEPTIVFWALLAIAIFGVLARVTRLPYPIVMVIGGALLALVPGLPRVHLPPDLVFVVILPPLLFAGGWTTDVRTFKRFIEPIALLAIGLVGFTTVVVAYFAHAFIGLPLASAFVLGAILSPPDAIATEAISESVPFPPGIEAILSGESLVNDASALVIYGFAVAAVLTGTFSLADAALEFAYVTVAGIAVGLAIAEVAARVLIALRRKGLVDGLTTTVITLVTPFVVYLPAQAVHASGVLAAVAAGISLNLRSHVMFDSESRLMANSAWGVTIFVLNGIAFLAIGLQLPEVFAALSSYAPATLAGYAAATCALVIGSRFAWIFVSVTTRRFFGRMRGLAQSPLTWRGMLVMSWAGMRGIVTLAAALALPVALPNGAPFPGRALILFLAFTVIVVTLVGQGTSLPFVMRKLDVLADPDDGTEFDRARATAATAARDRLRTLEADFTTTTEWAIAGRIISELDGRIDRSESDVLAHETDRALRRDLTAVQRETIARLRRDGEISDHVFRELQWELDLVDVQLG